jgi:predicted alpha/beta-fold hydrolase
MGEESKLTACINVSTPWDVKMTQPNMEENWINKKLYVDFLLSRVKDVVRRNSKILSKNPKINIDRVLQSTTMTEFDEHLTCPVHGFSSSDHYYSHCSIYNKLRRISVPFITVMSMDDPFAPADSIPIHEFERNPNTILILTRYGGHFGFIEGLYPNGPTWIDRLVGQFLATIKSELIR